MRDGVEIDLVTHDVEKFFACYSRKTAMCWSTFSCRWWCRQILPSRSYGISRAALHHQMMCTTISGFARTQWELFDKERLRRVKPLLYVYRVLLTGIHLMRTGAVEGDPRIEPVVSPILH